MQTTTPWSSALAPTASPFWLHGLPALFNAMLERVTLPMEAALLRATPTSAGPLPL